MVGGYATFALAAYLPIPLAVIGGAIIAALFNLLLLRGVYLPLKERQASGMVMLIASLGFFTIIQAGISILFSVHFQQIISPESITIFHLGKAAISSIHLWLIGLNLLCFVGIWAFLRYTKYGLLVRAVSDQPTLANTLGIKMETVISGVFIASGAIAGLGGILFGLDIGLEPVMDFHLLFKGLIAAIIGGMTLGGAFLGAFLLGAIENLGTWTLATEWKDAIAFIVLLLVLYFKPEGLIRSKKGEKK